MNQGQWAVLICAIILIPTIIGLVIVSERLARNKSKKNERHTHRRR